MAVFRSHGFFVCTGRYGYTAKGAAGPDSGLAAEAVGGCAVGTGYSLSGRLGMKPCGGLWSRAHPAPPGTKSDNREMEMKDGG